MTMRMVCDPKLCITSPNLLKNKSKKWNKCCDIKFLQRGTRSIERFI